MSAQKDTILNEAYTGTECQVNNASLMDDSFSVLSQLDNLSTIGVTHALRIVKTLPFFLYSRNLDSCDARLLSRNDRVPLLGIQFAGIERDQSGSTIPFERTR